MPPAAVPRADAVAVQPRALHRAEQAPAQPPVLALQPGQQCFDPLAVGVPVRRAVLSDRRNARAADKGADLLLLRVQQRPDEGDALAVEIGHGRKAAEPPLVEQIQQQRLDRVVEMVPERDLPAAVGQRGVVQRAAAQHRAERAGVFLPPYLEHDFVDVGLHHDQRQPQLAAERRDRRRIDHEGLELEDPANEPNYKHLLVLGCTPEEAPDEPEYVTMTFEKGVPKSVNGKAMKVSDIIRELNRLGAKHGIGIIDIVENRVVGMKSRGVYETPGGTILYETHQQLEELVLDRDTTTFKMDVGNKFAQVVYEGKWETPLREALQAFVEKTQEYVTGEVKFRLYKGNIIKAGTTSPYSLYNESIASFKTGDMYDHHDADGFINLFGLSLKVRAMKKLENEKKNNK